jgi:uncharacterized protein YndB with AHSA1/START domain
MTETRMSAHRRIAAPADRVWELVSNPDGHVRIDGSGMIEAALDARLLTSVGDTFDMDMDREPLGDVPLGKYQVRNWVTRIEPGRLIEWSTALIANDKAVGHVYGWEIEPVSESECDVTNYTDWSALPPAYQERWPIVPLSMLEQSVANLERIVTTG